MTMTKNNFQFKKYLKGNNPHFNMISKLAKYYMKIEK